MPTTFAGKVVLVTGAGRGIGEAVATEFGRRGAKVVLAARTQGEIERVADVIRGLGADALPVCVDVGNLEDVGRLEKSVLDAFGTLDILVNNAGIVRVYPAERLPVSEAAAVVNTNLMGLFYCCQMAGRIMIPHRYGKIINISSTGALAAVPGRSIYHATKAAVIALTRTLAVEWGKHNINVVAIAPGTVRTAMLDRLGDEGLEKMKARMPLRRLLEPSDVASLALFLASEDAKNITGVTIPLDAGWTAAASV